MASGELKSNNARSPRFSTSKALGFRGGSTSPSGNLQQPTFGQVEGTQRPNPVAGADKGNAIAEFSAPQTPKPPGVGSSIAATAGGLAAGEGLKAGGKMVYDNLRNRLVGGATSTLGPKTGSILAPGLQESGAETFPVSSVSAPESFSLGGDGDYSAGVGDLGEGINNGIDFAGGFDFGDGVNNGIDFAVEGGAEAAGGGIPYLGPALNLAAGNYGSSIGGAIGTYFGGPIGSFIGSTIGGAIDDGCFITEAVMSADGKGDNAEELEVLRQFRDSVLSQTPEGQQLIQEYEAIAPVVVDAVMKREDSLQIFQQIDAQFINPAVQAVKMGDNQKALQIYAQMISFVAPLAQEAGEGATEMPGETGQMDALQKFGEHAAMIGHDPMASGMATGEMGMLDSDPTGYDGGPSAPMGGGGEPGIMDQFASGKPRY